MTRSFVLSGVVALAFNACAAPAPTSMARENPVADAHTTQPRLLSLIRSDIDDATLAEDVLPEGFQLVRGASGGLFQAGRQAAVIGATRVAPLYWVKTPAGGGDFLAYRGSARYAVHAPDGAFIVEVPSVASDANAGTVTWRWKDSRTLVGVLEISEQAPPNRYPDADVLPQSTKMFIYRPNGADRGAQRLNMPTPSRGQVIRLEGVTSDGRLVLSEVTPEEYFGGPPTRILGAYQVAGDGSASPER